MKFLIPFLSFSAIFLGQASYAQSAVLEVRGCGTGCRIETEQLSAVSEMADGWVKVLERTAMRIVDMNGQEERYFRGQPMPIRDQHWVFAKCGDRWFGTGYKSDGSDARVEDIYDDQGNPKSYTAAGNVYDRFHALCEAPR